MDEFKDTYGIQQRLRLPVRHMHPYYKLFDELNRIPFTWSIPMDKNREKDGLNLRKGLGYQYTDPVTVLEVLAALAIRLDDEYVGNPADPRPDIIFWDMIKNLELDWCTDKQFDQVQVGEVIDRWMERRFLPDGTWSIFPLHDPKIDQRNIEIWSQAMAYITERWCS